MNTKQIPQVARDLKQLYQAFGERKRMIEKVLPDLPSDKRRTLVIRLSNNLIEDLGPIIDAIGKGEYDINWPKEYWPKGTYPEWLDEYKKQNQEV